MSEMSEIWNASSFHSSKIVKFDGVCRRLWRDAQIPAHFLCPTASCFEQINRYRGLEAGNLASTILHFSRVYRRKYIKGKLLFARRMLDIRILRLKKYSDVPFETRKYARQATIGWSVVVHWLHYRIVTTKTLFSRNVDYCVDHHALIVHWDSIGTAFARLRTKFSSLYWLKKKLLATDYF